MNNSKLEARFAAKWKISPGELLLIIAAAAAKLRGARERRERPLRDTKVICSWNSLMITALIKLHQVSGDRIWLEVAESTARFILSSMVISSGRLVGNWLGTPSAIGAFAEDYATFITALAGLAAESSEPLWLERLAFFTRELSRLFVNETGEGAFCGVDAEKLPQDIQAVQDGVLPSTVASCAAAFIRAGTVGRNGLFIERGRKIVERYRGITEKNPAACLSLIMAEEALAETD